MILLSATLMKIASFLLKPFKMVIARMDTLKYGETLCDTSTGMTHKFGKPLVRLRSIGTLSTQIQVSHLILENPL